MIFPSQGFLIRTLHINVYVERADQKPLTWECIYNLNRTGSFSDFMKQTCSLLITLIYTVLMLQSYIMEWWILAFTLSSIYVYCMKPWVCVKSVKREITLKSRRHVTDTKQEHHVGWGVDSRQQTISNPSVLKRVLYVECLFAGIGLLLNIVK